MATAVVLLSPVPDTPHTFYALNITGVVWAVTHRTVSTKIFNFPSSIHLYQVVLAPSSTHTAPSFMPLAALILTRFSVYKHELHAHQHSAYPGLPHFGSVSHPTLFDWVAQCFLTTYSVQSTLSPLSFLKQCMQRHSTLTLIQRLRIHEHVRFHRSDLTAWDQTIRLLHPRHLSDQLELGWPQSLPQAFQHTSVFSARRWGRTANGALSLTSQRRSSIIPRHASLHEAVCAERVVFFSMRADYLGLPLYLHSASKQMRRALTNWSVLRRITLPQLENAQLYSIYKLDQKHGRKHASIRTYHWSSHPPPSHPFIDSATVSITPPFLAHFIDLQEHWHWRTRLQVPPARVEEQRQTPLKGCGFTGPCINPLTCDWHCVWWELRQLASFCPHTCSRDPVIVCLCVNLVHASTNALLWTGSAAISESRENTHLFMQHFLSHTLKHSTIHSVLVRSLLRAGLSQSTLEDVNTFPFKLSISSHRLLSCASERELTSIGLQ